jgi:hypothetical protein
MQEDAAEKIAALLGFLGLQCQLSGSHKPHSQAV